MVSRVGSRVLRGKSAVGGTASHTTITPLPKQYHTAHPIVTLTVTPVAHPHCRFVMSPFAPPYPRFPSKYAVSASHC